MKAKFAIVVICLLLLSGAAYWYFEVKRQNSKIEHILPETGLFVLHGNNLRSTLNSLEDYEWFESLKDIPFIETLSKWSVQVDSLKESGKLQSDVTQLPYWISFHSTGSNQITPLYIIESKGFQWNSNSIVAILRSLTGEDFTTSNQVFNGFNLLNVKGANLNLVMLIQDQYLAISEENLLVEDVVRALDSEPNRLLYGINDSPVTGDLQLILNSRRLNELHSVFFKNEFQPNESFNVAFLNLDFDHSTIKANGSAILLGSITSSEASIFGMNLIPLSSTSFQWAPVQIGLDEFEPLLREEMLNISLDMNFSQVSEVLLLNTADTNYLRRELDKLSESKTSIRDSTVYSEYYLNTSLGYMQQSDFVSQLTSGKVEMGEPYYTIFQNLLLLSDNLDALKTVMNEFDLEATWGKSVERRRVLEDMVQETDFTLVQNFDYASEVIFEHLRPNWNTFLNERKGLINLFKTFQVQLNSSNNNYLVSSTIDLNENQEIAAPVINNAVPAADLVVKANVFADSTLTTKPHIVRNHLNSSLEIVFQDEANSIYLATRQGEILWKSKVVGQIKGSIHQIDYYNNKKLQYLFFTDSLVHLIDRNGEIVEGFPKVYDSSMEIDGTAVVDYDNSKRYRYLTKDRRGNLHLFDKEVSPLEGWSPNVIGSELLQMPFHVRVRGRDAFVAVERTGEISVLNRRGEYYPGFPKDFDLRYKGDVSLIKGPNFAGTRLAVIGQEGKLVQVNLEGNVVQEKQLFRPTTRSVFSMVSDVLETGFRIIRNDQTQVAFYDMLGDEVFEIPLENSGQLEVEFYNFRNGKELYAIRDIARNQLFLLNNEGDQISTVIPASERVSILYYQNLSEYEVFVNFANQLNIYAIDAR